MSSIKTNLKKSWLAKLGIIFILPALLKLRKQYNPNNYNGAMFMGLNGIAVKSHGGADAKAFANAICVAYNLAGKDVITSLKNEMAKIENVVSNQPSLSGITD